MKFKKSNWLGLFFAITFASCEKTEDTTNPTPQPTEPSLGFVAASSAELAGSESVPELLMGTLPSSFFLNMPTPGNQGGQGSCVSWATGYAAQSYFMNKANGTNYGSSNNLCSPKYLYNQSKYLSDCNGGSTYPAAFNILQTKGICTLSEMPYNDSECSLQPTAAQNTAAARNKILKWERLDKTNITNIKTVLYSGFPVMIAVTVDASFDNLQSPYIWTAKSGNARGGHAITVVGYDDTKNAFKVQNSWGTNWKDNGYLWISYSFFPTAVNSMECYVVYPQITSPTDNLSQGLIINLPFNGNANDVSGNNNNGTVSGATLTTDRKGNANSAYQFGGYYNQASVTVPNSTSLTLSTSFSISVWLKVNSLIGTGGGGITNPADGNSTPSFLGVFAKGDPMKGAILFDIKGYQNLSSVSFGQTNGSGIGSASSTIGSWMHYVFVYANSRVKVYKNGSLVWNVNSSINFNLSLSNTGSLKIGNTGSSISTYPSLTYPFNGTIDDFRIYNRALDESEIQKLYQL